MTATRITAPAGELALEVTEPATTGPWPGIVVLHDAFGMTDDLREQARWLAESGFLAAAPDLFRGGSKLACMVALMRQVRERRGRVFDDVEATRQWLSARSDCTGRIGVIGYCMGGGLALVLAPGHGFGAASVNYGTAPRDAYVASGLRGACPIVGSFGGRDPFLRGAAGRLTRACADAGVAHDVKEYPEAGHGFLNDHEWPEEGLWPLVSMAFRFVPNLGHHEPSARDARQRIVAFLHDQLGGTG